MAAPEPAPGFLPDSVSTTTWYDGSKLCANCRRLMTPVEVAYTGTLCPRCTRLARQRLLMNKRVGDL